MMIRTEQSKRLIAAAGRVIAARQAITNRVGRNAVPVIAEPLARLHRRATFITADAVEVWLPEAAPVPSSYVALFDAPYPMWDMAQHRGSGCGVIGAQRCGSSVSRGGAPRMSRVRSG